MSLLDQNNNKYLIKWKGIPGAWRKKAIPEIFNSNKQLVGKLDLTGKITKKLLMKDLTDSIILMVTKKTLKMTRTYELQDNQDNLIGIIKPPLLLSKSLSFFDLKKNELLKIDFLGEVKGNYFSGFEIKDFEISNFDGKKIAKVLVGSDKKFNLFDEMTWFIDIIDSTYNKKIILGLIMALFSSAFDSTPQEGGA